MTNEDIIGMAVEAGFADAQGVVHAAYQLEAFANLVAAHEREVTHTVIAGALFDFMGYLTSRRKRIVLSASDDAAPAANAVEDFAKKRGLSLDDAQVREWIEALAQPEQNLSCKSTQARLAASWGYVKAQPAQEPVAWLRDPKHYPEPDAMIPHVSWKQERLNTIPLYRSPPKRQPLTGERVKGMVTENGYDKASPQERADFINGIRNAEVEHDIGDKT